MPYWPSPASFSLGAFEADVPACHIDFYAVCRKMDTDIYPIMNIFEVSLPVGLLAEQEVTLVAVEHSWHL